MNKTSKIKEIESKINHYDELIEEYKAEIEKINNLTEISITDLILEFHKEDSVFVKKEKTQSQYKYILGGDGRSDPWDENRMGLVLKIQLFKIYVSDEDLKKFIEFLKATKEEEVKAIFINNYQKFPK